MSYRFLVLSQIVAWFAITAAVLAHAHSGGLDKLGCHHNRKQGGYHCHRGELDGQRFPSKDEAVLALEGGAPTRPKSSPSAVPVAYNRKLYGGWIDQDRDCQNTRQEVLIAESTIPVTLDTRGCKVISGKWYDPYTGRVFTTPQSLDIDHFIPLSEVHRSGGHAWTSARRRQYANDLSDPNTLIAVWKSANRSKGDRDPANWLPSNKMYRCKYLKIWVKLKRHWSLSADSAERQFLNKHKCLNGG